MLYSTHFKKSFYLPLYFIKIYYFHFLCSQLYTFTNDIRTVETRSKKQLGKHIIVPYCKSFPYCEYSSFIKVNFGQDQHSVVASFYTTSIMWSLLLRVLTVLY